MVQTPEVYVLRQAAEHVRVSQDPSPATGRAEK